MTAWGGTGWGKDYLLNCSDLDRRSTNIQASLPVVNALCLSSPFGWPEQKQSWGRGGGVPQSTLALDGSGSEMHGVKFKVLPKNAKQNLV